MPAVRLAPAAPHPGGGVQAVSRSPGMRPRTNLFLCRKRRPADGYTSREAADPGKRAYALSRSLSSTFSATASAHSTFRLGLPTARSIWDA